MHQVEHVRHSLTYGESQAESPQSALSDDVAVVRGRILVPLLEPPNDGTVRRLVDTIQVDGAWPDVDYADSRRSGWRTYRHQAVV